MRQPQRLALVVIPVLLGAVGCVSLASSSLARPANGHSANGNAIAQNQNSGQPGNPANGQRRQPPRINFAAAAAKLGITEAQLKAALGVPANPPGANGQPNGQANGQPNGQNGPMAQNGQGQKRPPKLDIKGAAAKLGISEQKLVNALGLPPHPPRPDLKAAAAKLGVTEAQLKAALGMPANPPSEPPNGQPGQRPPRPDLKAAAAKLGVTEQQLIDALGIPPRPPEGQGPNQGMPPAPGQSS